MAPPRKYGKKGAGPLAKLVTGVDVPCAFCQRKVDDEITHGKLYAIGDIQCHYFCVLLSCCLVQQGNDEEGLFGFMYTDILAELERSKKHRCSYCGRDGATLGCSVSQCRKQFHLPCGRERNAISLFYGNYKSFCQQHAPKQKIPDSIMVKAKLRMKDDRKRSKNLISPKNINNLKELAHESQAIAEAQDGEVESVCVICYERVEGYPTLQTFWPPCCARDAWFHRSCLQRMALSAGMHYLKCPLCNDKDHFYQAVVSQGYYVPDRDAAWELEQNAFAEIYDRPLSCGAAECRCPMGRNHDSESGAWDIKLCILCGSSGRHAHCLAGASATHVCGTCRPAAPLDLDTLTSNIEAVILQEQTESTATVRQGPVMPSRMSLRRTKQRVAAQNTASSSSSTNVLVKTESTSQAPSSNLPSSRLDLNLKTPKKPVQTILDPKVLKGIENILISPIKLLENTFHEKVTCMGVKDAVLDSRVVEEMRARFRKPKPLSEKRRIVNDILDGMLNDILIQKPKHKEPVKEWCSPKKFEIKEELFEETFHVMNSEHTENFDESISEICHTDNKIQSEKIYITTPNKVVTPNNPLDQLTTDNTKDIDVNGTIKEDILSQNDDSSNSTFQLSPEFIADHNSNDSLLLFDTPKKLKTVDIQKDSSLEISENDQIVNIDVITLEENNQKNDFIEHLNLEIPTKNKKCAFKFSPVDKETLQRSNIDIDMESFKNHYLNEVDREFKCNFNHKHSENTPEQSKLRTAIDFAVDAVLKKDTEEKPQLKRQLATKQSLSKRRKMVDRKLVLKFGGNEKDTDRVKCKPKSNLSRKIKSLKQKNVNIKYVKRDTAKDNLKITVDSAKKNKKQNKLKKKHKTKLSLRNKDIKVKIKWRREQLRLKITESKTKKYKRVTQNESSLKQYVLQYSPETSEKVLVKPESDVTPIKRRYSKKEKGPDNLVQTSIQNFFKITSPKE